MSDQWQAIDSNSRGSLTAVSTADDKTIVRLTADPITGALMVSGGSGITSFSQLVLTATGVVNGLNTQFVFTQEPTYIISDSAWYAPLDNNGNVQWSWNAGTLTATMTIPPSSNIVGVM